MTNQPAKPGDRTDLAVRHAGRQVRKPERRPLKQDVRWISHRHANGIEAQRADIRMPVRPAGIKQGLTMVGPFPEASIVVAPRGQPPAILR